MPNHMGVGKAQVCWQPMPVLLWYAYHVCGASDVDRNRTGMVSGGIATTIRCRVAACEQLGQPLIAKQGTCSELS